MKPRDYCCCAIPIVNAGIYATITEQLLVAFLIGILSVATPSIVGAATPSSASWILAVICFLISAIQILGFLGVAQEKVILYRRYVTLHTLATSAAFGVAAAWEILSATRHATAKSRCMGDFFPSNDSTVSSEGDTLCELFPWIDIGVMGGIWVVLAILHVYLYVVLSSYGTSQRHDHEKYDQLNNESIPMNKRGDPWDARPSTDVEVADNAHSHFRQESASDILSEPHLQPGAAFTDFDPTHQQEPPRNHIHRGLSKRGEHRQSPQA